MNNNTQLYYNTLLYLLKNNKRTSEAVATLTQQTLDVSLIATIEKASKIIIGQSQKGNEDELFSIFDNLDKKDNFQNKVPQRVIGLQKEDAFPNGNNQDTREWAEGFKADVALLHLTDSPTAAQVDTLLFVLQKWTAQIPSNEAKDIPFFDFAKLTAAATLCLQNADNQGVPFLLVGGGVSGVQDYLYDIVSKNASKNLKGRSFYIQMLSDAVLYKIINALGLFQCNIVYASGGRFYILTPNNALIIKQLEKVKAEIANALFDTHRIALYMELQSVECSESGLKDKFGEVCNCLSGKIGEEKKHKFNTQIKNNFSELFEPSEVGGETFCDAISGEEFSTVEKKFILEEALPEPFKGVATEDDILVNEKTALQIHLGFGLKSGNLYNIDLQQVTNKKGIDFSVKIGVTPDLKEKGETAKGYLFELNDLNFLDKYQDINVVKGYQFYGGNNYPKIYEINRTKHTFRSMTFTEMGGMAENLNDFYSKSISKRETTNIDYLTFKEEKFKRLGVLRMDVDGLGTIFRNGLPSLAAYSTLSSRLDWFFKGYLNTIWERDFDGEDGFTQIIYSGGDDLFIVGRWNEIIDFAEVIQREFKDYVKNDVLTISAGIAIVTPKFPIMKAANQFAADAEKAAKKHPNKNAIHLFGETFSWNEEFTKVKELKDYIVSHKEDLPRSFIYKVNSFYEKYKSGKDYTWCFQMAYDIQRQYDRLSKEKKEEDVGIFLKSLVQFPILKNIDLQLNTKTIKTDIHFFRLLNTAVIWASYELRNEDENKKS